MSVAKLILLIIVSSTIGIDGRSLNNPSHFIPSFLSSVITDNNDLPSSSFNGQNQLLHIMEHIIKYVSKIRSSENFIDEVVNHQEQPVDKLKILKFLKNCFQLTHTLIQREINRLSEVFNTNEKSLFSSSFTLEELQEAQHKIHHLLQAIEERMETLKTWIPPTMPFLNF